MQNIEWKHKQGLRNPPIRVVFYTMRLLFAVEIAYCLAALNYAVQFSDIMCTG